MKPGDVAIVHPTKGQGCPCEHCSRDWHEGLYADGHRERAGICPMLRELVSTRAGCVSHYCPIPAEVGGEIYWPGRVEWQPVEFVPYDRTPAKGAAQGSRNLDFPTIPGRGDGPSQKSLPIARRERSNVPMNGRGAAPLVSEPPQASNDAPLPESSRRWFY